MIATSRELFGILKKHIDGLPKYVTGMVIKMDFDGLVEVTTTFHPVFNGHVTDEPVTKTFKLVENENETDEENA